MSMQGINYLSEGLENGGDGVAGNYFSDCG